MEPATLGAPSGDGFSWTIIVDTYNHLMAVHSRLTDRISLLLIQLLSKGNKTVPDLWVIAVNPHNDTVRSDLHQTLSSAATAFLSHRDFSVVLDLNCRVQRWCSSVLKTSCKVCGGRLVITNKITETTSCSWMGKVPFSLLCLPVAGLRKLFYKFRRMSGCDIVICFQDEELTLCTRTGQLKQCADVNKTPLENFSAKKAPARIKKNRQAVEVATQTSNSDLESYDDDCDENDEPSLQAEETDVERGSPDDLYTKYTASESASLANSGSDCDSTRGTYHQTVTRIQSTMDTTMQPLAPHSTASTDLQNHCLTSAFPRR
ncbi:uncharacterized protein LOC112560744 isoform X2 [Pomacea canaliculata]|uniref:uncharacterized protein LOC112560744 isoform X2 n=1 Tax=Pomacea canaliculata TaxID=400727 RepID=UPI000D727D12|nr:uncharacterized protein LOC112560744 isoform X2 [Pomacea canaliculata]